MSLDWRKTEKEGYIKVNDKRYVKKDTFDYFTEKDLVRRYSEKKGLPEDSVNEMYLLLIKYIKNILNYSNDEEKGYYIRELGYILKRNLFAKDLLSKKDSITYKRAKSQLDLYMKTGKKIRIC